MNTLRLPFDPEQAEQNSPRWHILKLGVISASRIKDALAKIDSATRQSYMAELVAQICTGEKPEINAKQLEWGQMHEAAARNAYELLTDHQVSVCGFKFHENLRSGCSPDGEIKSLRRGVEIKCPYSSKVFIEFLTCDQIKDEYKKQCQFGMWITGFETWDFVNYDPRMEKNMLHYVTLERDEKLMKEFNEKIPEFIYDMDKMLLKAGYQFGDQWKQYYTNEISA